MSILPALEVELEKGLGPKRELEIENEIKKLSSVFNTSMSGGGETTRILATLKGSSQEARADISKIQGVKSIRHAL